MPLEVNIPDQVYDHARQAAVQSGISFDRFVSDAMMLHLKDAQDGPEPTPELVASLRKAEAEIDSGKGLTMAQVDKNLTDKRATWLQANSR